MIEQFAGLHQDEVDLMLDSIPLITLLIGAADGKLDQEEKEWATKVTDIRSYTNEDSLKDFYEKIGENFTDRLQQLIQEYPDDTAARNEQIAKRLEGLNPVLAKLEPEVGAKMYKDFRSFATHVAKASGGFLRFGSISKEERQWVELPMLTPIELES